MKHPSSRTREDFEAIEAAVLESERGRWFLAEYLRRHQARETQNLLAAIHRLESALEGGTAIARIRGALAEAARALTASEGDGAALPEAIDELAAESAALAAGLEEMQPRDEALRAEIVLTASRQHAIARRLEIIAAAFREIAAACGERMPEAEDEPELMDENAGWFARDEEFFSAPAGEDEPAEELRETPEEDEGERPAGTVEILPPRAEDAPAAAEEAPSGRMTVIVTTAPRPGGKARGTDGTDGKEKNRPRIVITRRSSSEELDIPLAGAEGASPARPEK